MSLFHKEVRSGLYHIGDGRGNFCTLIVGETGAVLYDTMLGFDDLKSYVAELSRFEPMVINSHCHFDHMGGNWQFDRVYMSEADFPLMELGHSRIPTLTETLNADLSVMECCYTDWDRVSAIDPETVIDLGGRTVKVIALPGHTPGCIGLLCVEERLLLAGDALSPQYCIFFRESLPLSVSRETMKKLWELPFDHFLSSHFDRVFDKEIMHKFEACFELVGKKRGMQYVYQILPEEQGRFFVYAVQDPDIGELIGIAVKESEAAILTKDAVKVK